MNKRDFIKTGLLGAIGLLCLSSFTRLKGGNLKSVKSFKLPELPYAYDALEPYIDKETMLLHHSKHFAAYTDKFNSALLEQGIAVGNIREIIDNASKYNLEIQKNGGGYFNHRIFFKMLSPKGGGPATGKIADAINSAFGSFDKFKEEFSSSAKKQFGSGWTWLINQNGALKIINTTNQENPLMDTLPPEKRGFPVLCIDVWEHSYYLKYQNRRAEYINAFWNIVNWDTVNIRYNKSIS
jgi:Fe-Mn family superoxide dismutase